ncbi:MAG: PorV/PorQ family protein [Ignavibacteria bacterium]|nr:PorV/PorQ family protein [Ignavibacteria bacterium]
MKKIIMFLAVILLTCTSYEAFAQTYNAAFYELFFGRQPSARAEAMGRSLATITGDPVSYYYNPAGMASLKGLNLNAGFAGPYYLLDDAYYDYFGGSYNIKKYGTVGLSSDYFNWGIDVNPVSEFGDPTGESYEPHVTNYRMTLASEVIKDFFVGVNLNLLSPDQITDSYTVGNEKGEDKDVFYFDLGVIKSFNIQSGKLNHKINMGSSLINVNSAKYSGVDEAQADRLPVIFRLGASYDLLIDDKSISSKLKSYNILANLEYEDLFNSKYYGGVHTGLEFTFLEILSLRGGYYSQKLNDYGYSENYKDNLSEFTYGFGLNVPVMQLSDSKVPLQIKLDFVSLKQPTYITTTDDWENFHVYTVIINWIF